jgi:hypothetical protein
MIKFTEWLVEFAGVQQAPNQAQPMTGAAPGQPQAQPQGQPNVGMQEEPVKAMLRTRLQQVFKELDGYKIPKDKQVKLLAHVVSEFQQQLGMSNSNIKRSVAMAAHAPVPAA